MIQRIQSVYLTLTIILSFLFLTGAIFNFPEASGSVIRLTFNGLERYSGEGITQLEKLLPFSILIMLIPLVALASIFLFRNRKLQSAGVITLIVLISIFILLTGYYAWHATTAYDAGFTFGIKLPVPFIMLLLSILAYRGIIRDEQLVKSYDRLR